MYSNYSSKLTSSFNTKYPTTENSNGKKKSERKNIIKSRKYVLKYCVCVNLLKIISQKYNGEHY